MNPELPTDANEALEPNLTTLLLGELPEAQAEELRRAIERSPTLTKEYEQLKATIGLIRQAEELSSPTATSEGAAPDRLSAERREQLLQAFKTVRPPPFQQPVRRESRWLVPAAAACAILSTVAALMFLGQSQRGYRMAQLEPADTRREMRRKLVDAEAVPSNADQTFTFNGRNRSYRRAGTLSESVETPASPAAATTDFDLTRPVDGVVRPSERNLAETAGDKLQKSLETLAPAEVKLGKSEERSKDASSDALLSYTPPSTGGFGGAGGLGGGAPTTAFGDQPELGAAFKKDVAQLSPRSPVQRSLQLSEAQPKMEAQERLALQGGRDSAPGMQDRFGIDAGKLPSLAEEPPMTANYFATFQASQSAAASTDWSLQVPNPSEATLQLRNEELLKETENKLKSTGSLEGVAGVSQPADSKKLDHLARNAVVVAEADQAQKEQVDKKDLGINEPVAAPQPLLEVQTKEQPFSTFSLNVSDVSFRLAGASLEQGKLPAPASIRSEEFLNAFDYRDPEAPPGQRVAFAWDRATYPFAQNRDLLRVSLKTAAVGRDPARPLNLVILLDNSGSMERADRVKIIREALRVVAGQLRTNDTFSVITFARTARLFADGVPGDQAGRVAQDLEQLAPQGGTNLEEAMNLAYQTAVRHYAANALNRVVLLTDGAANLGDTHPEVLRRKVESYRKQGIALDCFGIGWEGYNDNLLEQLTRHGDGRYGFLNTPEEASTLFADKLAGALQVAAADVKVQIEFNPARVTSYRQIGYSNHQLKREEFRDNTVDAAEIGSGESGNALYVIETAPQGQGPIGVFRVRYLVPGTHEYREQEWTIPYTGSAVSLDKAGAATRLAAVAGALAEWLAGSPYAAEITPDVLFPYLNGVPAEFGADPRPHRLEWMLHQAKALRSR